MHVCECVVMHLEFNPGGHMDVMSCRSFYTECICWRAYWWVCCITVCTGFHINIRQTEVLRSRPFSLSLCLCLVEFCRTPGTEWKTCDWMITRSAGLSQPTNSLCFPSQNPWGWHSVSSTRSPGCPIINWSPDAMISFGDPCWNASRQLVLYAVCGCQILAMLCEQHQNESRKFWNVLMKPHPVTASDVKHEQ